MRRSNYIVAALLATALFGTLVSFSSSALGANAPAAQAADPKVEQAKQLVHDRCAAEVDGNTNLHDADLKQALSLTPDLQEVHWQLGEVRRGDRWLATGDA